VKIVDETTHDDASAWTAVVEVRGVLYRAGYVNSKLGVSLVAYKNPPRRPRWALESVRTWAEKRVAELPHAWMAAHRAMYQGDVTATANEEAGTTCNPLISGAAHQLARQQEGCAKNGTKGYA
jgi:hypothetical protein